MTQNIRLKYRFILLGLSLLIVLYLYRQTNLERLHPTGKDALERFLEQNEQFSNIQDSSLHGTEFPGRPDPCPKDRRTNSDVENILCMKRPSFLPQYKNPCWRENIEKGRLRCLPYFHIIGAPKSATTDLYSRLIQHPQIVKNKGRMEKETWFWSWRRYRHMDREWYGFQDIKLDADLAIRLKAMGMDSMINASRLMTLNEFTTTFDADEIENSVVDGNHTFITGHGDPMDFADFHWNFNIPQNDPGADELVWTTPYLIKHVNPGVKLILLLRDPVERLYSYYIFRRQGYTSMKFHNDVQNSLNLWTACVKQHSHRHCLYDMELYKNMKNFMNLKLSSATPFKLDIINKRSKIHNDVQNSLNLWAVCIKQHSHRHCLYDMELYKNLKVALYSSFYSSHLKEWLKVFPRQQILILRTEDYRKDIKGTLQRVFDFLKISRLSDLTMNEISASPKVYVTENKTRAGDMMPETRKILAKFYRESTIELSKLLGDERFAFNDV